jgi:hypothetical protein
MLTERPNRVLFFFGNYATIFSFFDLLPSRLFDQVLF